MRMWYSAITLLVGVVVCLALMPRVAFGQPGVQWTARDSAADNNWYSVTFGGGQFVAVSNTGNGNRVMTSPDGVSWTSRNAAAENSWLSVAYGNGIYVAVAYAGDANRVMTSLDGITWTARAAGAERRWRSVTYAEGRFVAVADGATGSMLGSNLKAMTSTDGINWTASSAPGGWFSVVHGEGLFVAVGGGDVMTSSDGNSWAIGSLPAGINGLTAVTYGAGRFVAVALNGVVVTSEDGLTWTPRTAPSGSWSGVTYGAGLFVAVSFSSAYVMTSPDGINWTAQVPAANNQWWSVTYGNGTFVAVALSGTGNRVMTSGAFLPAPDPPTKPTATAGNAQATVGVTPGAGSGGAPASYTVTSSPDGRTCTVTVPATSCTVTGLTNGTPYTFIATAINSTGTSGPSAPSDPVTPTAPPPPPAPSDPVTPTAPPPPPPAPSLPGAPTGVTVASGDESARVAFTGSGSGEGTVRYTVTARPRLAMLAVSVGRTQQSPWDLALDGDGTAYVTGLQYIPVGRSYRTNIAATSRDGRFGSVPVPTSAHGVVTDAQGTLYWTVPRAGTVVKYTPGGESSVLASVGGEPEPIAMDAAGNLYTGDARYGTITKVSPDGGTVVLARLRLKPMDIAVDGSGRVHVLACEFSGTWGCVLERFDPSGGRVRRLIAGAPQDLAVDAQGNAYIANLRGYPVTRIALDGTETQLGRLDSGIQIVGSNAVAVRGDGTVFVAAYLTSIGYGAGINTVGPDGQERAVWRSDLVARELTIDGAGDLYWVARDRGQLMRGVPLDTRTCAVVAPPSASGRLGCNLTGLVNGALYDVTVQAVNDVGEGPTSDPARADPQAKLQAFVAEPPVASAGAVTSLSAKMALAGSTMSASATPARGAAAANSRHPMLRTPLARGVTRVRGRCTTRGLTATCRLRLASGRWRITLTERNTGAVVGQASTVLRVAGARRAAVTG